MRGKVFPETCRDRSNSFFNEPWTEQFKLERGTPMNENDDATQSNRPADGITGKKEPPLLLDPSVILLALAAVIAVSAIYYFVFALPGIKREALEWEKEKYRQEAAAKASMERERREKQARHDSCVEAAEKDYWEYIKLNGRLESKDPETYSAPEYVWDTAQEIRKSALNACTRKYGQ